MKYELFQELVPIHLATDKIKNYLLVDLKVHSIFYLVNPSFYVIINE